MVKDGAVWGCAGHTENKQPGTIDMNWFAHCNLKDEAFKTNQMMNLQTGFEWSRRAFALVACAVDCLSAWVETNCSKLLDVEDLHTENQRGGLWKTMGDWNLAKRVQEGNNCCWKSQDGDILSMICWYLPMEEIASRKLPTVGWWTVRSWVLHVQIHMKMA